MATETSSVPSMATLITTLTDVLQSASTSIPDTAAIIPPSDGISLFDTKNEIFLSYLQNLSFFILLKLRQQGKNTTEKKDSDKDAELDMQEDVVKKLHELRIFLEKGVRPLEGRLKYQIDKVVRAAEDQARTSKGTANGSETKIAEKKATKAIKDDNGSDSNISDNDSSEDEDETETTGLGGASIDELAYRPNPASLLRKAPIDRSNRDRDTISRTTDTKSTDGIYRPPKITPVSLPTTEPREKRTQRGGARSHTLDEYVAEEFSTAPSAQPSIGSTIVDAGRKTKSTADRARERERREYEEMNFVRLPKESKKERKRKGLPATDRGAGYGGEDWRGLGEGADRIERLTRRGERGGRGGVGGALERSRKRGFEESGAGGNEIGKAFEKRRKKVGRR